MTIARFSLFLLVVFVCVVQNSAAAEGNGTIKVTIPSGKSQTIRCSTTGEVITVIQSKFIRQSSKGASSTPGVTKRCSSDEDSPFPIRRQCNKKATCTITANDTETQNDDKSCTTKRPLFVEYKCAAPGASDSGTSRRQAPVVFAMVNELL